MAPTFPISAPPAPPPSASFSSGSTDPAGQGGRSFSDVLKETTAQNASGDPPGDAAGAAAQNPVSSKNADADGSASSNKTNSDETSSDNTSINTDGDSKAASANGGTEDAAQSGQAQQASADATVISGYQKIADDKSVKRANSDSAARGESPDVKVPQTPLAADQPISALTDQQKGNQKGKKNKSESTSNAADQADQAVNPATQPAILVDTSSVLATDKSTDSQTDAKETDTGKHPIGTADKQSSKSELHAEQSLQPADANNAGAKQKSSETAGANTDAAGDAASTTTAVAGDASGATAADTAKTTDHPALASVSAFEQQLAGAASSTKTVTPGSTAAASTSPQLPPAPATADFAAANHAQIVSSVHAQLLPNGGSIQLRLDPPDLGTMQVTVRMRDGMMSAEFQASSEQSAKLLSHSLGDLKTQLETQGVTVEKLHVTSAPRDTRDGGSGSDSRQREQNPSHEQQREQQRKEMIRRMWAKLAKGKLPLDMVA